MKIKKKKKAVADGKIEFIVPIKQWIHQGFTYLDKTEMFYRLIWEIIPFTFFLTIVYFNFHVNIYISISLSFLISHTLNWIFNYNFWTCLCFTFPKIKNPGNEKTIKYLIEIQNRMIKSSCVAGCMLYGSLARSTWHIKSDLDMRILRKPGILNGLNAYLVVFKERIIAVLKKQPLDLYMADSIEFLEKLREDEFPIFLKNNDERLFNHYKSKETIDFNNVNSLNELSHDFLCEK